MMYRLQWSYSAFLKKKKKKKLQCIAWNGLTDAPQAYTIVELHKRVYCMG